MPEWERVPEVAADPSAERPEDADLAAPESYRVTLADRDVLYNLSALAEKNGGQLVDGSGRSIRAHELTVEENYAVVNVVVPVGKADTVRGQLSGVGATRASGQPAGAVMSSADNAVFVVEVSYQP